MTTTRSAARKGESPIKDEGPEAATQSKSNMRTKRTLSAPSAPTPQAKRGKVDDDGKSQKTIEETLSKREDGANDEPEKGEGEGQKDAKDGGEEEESQQKSHQDTDMKDEGASGDESEVKAQGEEAEAAPEASKGSAVIEDAQRAEEVPSSVLEKGIIYFFFRVRVDVEKPQGAQDIARSYLVLRPLPLGAKLGEGPLGDVGNCRLLALPKKVLPVSHEDRFMVFVEKANTTLKELKEKFLAGSEYETQTLGARHTPAATPSGEGVYAITTRGRDSHLSYILTVPSEINEVQKELGLRERASFVTSVKNPTAGGPARATLSQPADFDKEALEEFHGRAWTPLRLRLLDYDNAQVLLIGEHVGDISKTVEPTGTDKKDDQEALVEELEKLEHEDEIRVSHLKGDDPVLLDLSANSQEYSKLQTTW